MKPCAFTELISKHNIYYDLKRTMKAISIQFSFRRLLMHFLAWLTLVPSLKVRNFFASYSFSHILFSPNAISVAVCSVLVRYLNKILKGISIFSITYSCLSNKRVYTLKCWGFFPLYTLLLDHTCLLFFH